MAKSVTIVGGGLAGLTLGIGLRQRDVPVVIWEAGRYPRHRVCGEFISGGGQGVLIRLGLQEGLKSAGAIPVVTTAFFDRSARVVLGSLPDAAVGISRFVLDDWLAREYQRLGGDLHLGARWTGEFGPGIIRSTGRRVEPAGQGWRLFGLKAHARNVPMDADLEMHFGSAGYIGVCRLTGGEVNICGLFRSQSAVPDLARRWRDWLGGELDSILRQRLADAQWDEASFCSVAGLSLRPERAMQRRECCVGDAVTMIPPVTGNGMSMALESAEVAIDPLVAFSRGVLTWDQAQQQIADTCDRQFRARLRWATWLQRVLFHPPTRSALLFMAAHASGFWRGVFKYTR